MKRLLVNVEGHTEEQFVNNVLADFLYSRGFSRVSARLVGNPRQRDRRGGIRGWPVVKSDIVKQLTGDHELLVTTMVDYYALPKGGSSGWPGREVAPESSYLTKATAVESGVLADLQKTHGSSINCSRFVPYVMMYEFEGLLFSDCEKFLVSLGLETLLPKFQTIREQFDSPEQINDSPLTAPSKRILDLIPNYQKPLFGVVGASEIGVMGIAAECSHFSEWLDRLLAV